MAQLRVVGKSVKNIAADLKALGSANFSDDFNAADAIWGKVLRSKYPSAIIKSIRTDRARRHPGVCCVLTAADISGAKTFGLLVQDQPLLAQERVRFLGEAIALVAADTEAAAQKAIELIEVDYEETPGVYLPEDAMAEGAPQVHQGNSNVMCELRIRKGEADKAMAQADVVVENTYKLPVVDNGYIELESGAAWVEKDGTLVIKSGMQDMFERRGMVALALGLPQSRVKIAQAYTGGSFGGKICQAIPIYLGLLALKTGRTVKMAYTREESIISQEKRHPMTIRYKSGAMRSGKIVAADITVIADCGAYVHLTPLVMQYMIMHIVGPYEIDNVKVDVFGVFTNNTFSGAMRGFGATQSCFAYESQIDSVASALGLDRLEVRRANFLKKGKLTALGTPLKDYVALPECLDRAWAALGPETDPSTLKRFANGKPRIGRGVSCNITTFGFGSGIVDGASARVEYCMDGSVVVSCGSDDIGCGRRTIVAQIAAEVLGCDYDKVAVDFSDTSSTANAGMTAASRQTFMSGNAALQAAKMVRSSLLDMAGKLLDVPPEIIELSEGKAFSKEDPTKNIALSQVALACHFGGKPLSAESYYTAPATTPMDPRTGHGSPSYGYVFGCHAAEVAVDEETGKVDVLKLAVAHDVGRAIHPINVEGQMIGGSAMALGYTLMEEILLQKGYTETLTLEQYLMPTSADIPDITTFILETPSPDGPFGAKGVGEPPTNTTAPAITNAIYNAVGVRLKELPATPERVALAIKAARGK